MRIAIVPESFPPDVTASPLRPGRRTPRHRGHEPLVIAPGPPSSARSVTDSCPVPSSDPLRAPVAPDGPSRCPRPRPRSRPPTRSRAPGQPVRARRAGDERGRGAGTCRPSRSTRPICRLRAPVLPLRTRRTRRLAVDPPHAQHGRPDPGPVHRGGDLAGRTRRRAGLAVAPRRRRGPLRPGPAQRPACAALAPNGELLVGYVERRTWPAVCDELIQHYVAVHSGALAVRPVEVPA